MSVSAVCPDRNSYHRAVVLNCVRQCRAVSRTKIAELTGIRLASITELVKGLCDEGLVGEIGQTDNGARGRKRVQLGLRKDYGFAVGVEFDADHVAATVLNVAGEVVGHERRSLAFGPDGESGVAQILDIVKTLCKKMQIGLDKLVGVGLADPGLVDSAEGVSILSTTIPGWRDVPLVNLVGGALQVPAYLEENTRAKLLAEKTCGAARDADYVMYVDFGYGIGCSVSMPNGAYRGHTESAGELGHTCVVENGPICQCGSYGCLETVASLPAIARLAREAIAHGGGSQILELADGKVERITPEHVFQAGRQRDKLALAILEQTGRYLGVAIANAVNLFNPELIVFDSRMASVADLLVEPIKNVVIRQALRVATKGLRFEVSQLGEQAGALGAATFVLEKFFAVPQLSIPRFSNV
ncbi:MAG: ROK family protein [Sedimentisphaerales bacterium]|nr:ROK family protein [Sedimentisphaerales bacterium]